MSTVGLLIVTLLSGALAAVMSAIAWRVAREERLRAEARIALLAAEIHAEDSDASGAPVPAAVHPPVAVRRETPRRFERPTSPRRVASIDDLPLRDASVTDVPTAEPLHFTAPAPVTRFRFATVAGIGVFVVSSFGALAVLLSPGSETAPRAPVAAAVVPSDLTRPLELIALGHERFGERLTVRGIVRNPSSGEAVERLVAVVMVFNGAGESVSSARAAVQASGLKPGDESAFVVAIPSAADISRYRVSFRADERVLSHIDKREPATVARMQ